MDHLEDQQRQLAALRRSARLELDRIAEVCGRDSDLLRRGRDAWRIWEAAATASLLHGDVGNALVILDRGVHALRHALAASGRERLAADELFALLAAG